MTTPARTASMTALGVLVVILSIVLAVTIHYKHFYEILLLGQFIALYSLPSSKIRRRTYSYLYIIFMGSGIIADLFMGRYVGEFWHYNNFGLADYIILYVFTYPVAGIVMVQSFLAAKELLLGIKDSSDWRPALGKRQYAAVSVALGIAIAGTLDKVFITPSQNFRALDYVLAVLLACLVLSFVTAVNNHKTLIDDVHHQPPRMLASLFAAAYLNAFLHEIPNIFAHEWTYTNYPLPTVHIFNIPAIALMGWPLLLLFPLSVYYWVMSLPSSP